MTHTSDSEAAAARLIDLVGGYVASQIIVAMARFDLAEHLCDKTRSSAELATVINAHPVALLRFLRAAARYGLLEEVAADQFRLTPVGSWLRRQPDGSCLRNFAMGLASPGMTRPFEYLDEAVLNGQPTVVRALGSSLWEYFDSHPVELANFAGAMGELAAAAAEQIVARIDLSGFTRIVDIGGSQGVVLARLLEAAPQARGVLFDRPEVIAGAREPLARRGLAERVELVGGDFLEEVPAGGDLYILREVLHNWDDGQAARILANCSRAGQGGSMLLLGELLLPERSEPSVAFTLDLAALVMFGGRERTLSEYERLLGDAKYKLERILPAGSYSVPWSVLVAKRLLP